MSMAMSRMARLSIMLIATFAVLVCARSASAATVPLPLPGLCLEAGDLKVGDCPGEVGDAPGPDDARPGDRSLTRRGCKNALLVPDDDNLRHIRRATVCLVNKERTKRDRAKVKAHSTLGKAARRYADEMVEEEFFDHISPEGSTLSSRVKRTSYLRSSRIRRWYLGENLAWGTGERATPLEIVDSWMDSKGHRANILRKRFRELGVGVTAYGVLSRGLISGHWRADRALGHDAA